jgi:phosphorylcholine metabolism protein LicD
MAINTIKIFNENDIDYYIDFGTLLGIYREKDIILDDNDVDICVFDSSEFHEKIPKIKKEFKKKNLVIKKQTWSAYRVFYPPFRYFCDIYLVRKDGDIIRDPVTPKSDIPISLVGNKRIINWKGIDVKCPEKLHELLVFRYGDDYMVPKRGFKGNI